MEANNSNDTDKKAGTKRSAEELGGDGENHEPRSKLMSATTTAKDEAQGAKKTKKSTKMIAPMEPRMDPFQSIVSKADRHKSSQFVVYLAVAEDGSHDNPWTQGLAKCAAACSKEIQSRCFQRNGTRHVTLWQGSLTWEQAGRLAFSSSSSPSDSSDSDTSMDNDMTKPIEVDIAALTPWKGGVYLQLSKSCTRRLMKVLDDFLPALMGGKKSCDHMSLYRKRNAPKSAFTDFARIRKAVANHEWGSVAGVSIRIKQVGTEYDECRVLWSSSSTSL